MAKIHPSSSMGSHASKGSFLERNSIKFSQKERAKTSFRIVFDVSIRKPLYKVRIVIDRQVRSSPNITNDTVAELICRDKACELQYCLSLMKTAT